MKVSSIVWIFPLVVLAIASPGDLLPDYKACLLSCNLLLKCGGPAISNMNSAAAAAAGGIKERDQYNQNPSSYSYADFLQNYELNALSRNLFQWDCFLNCKYKCIRFITANRIYNKLEVFQYYGKWPFYRVLGVTELFSTLFSMANFYSNYVNIAKVARAYRKSKLLLDSNGGAAVMYLQYLVLLMVSCTGWILSTIFHIRDFPLTETLDYFGAGAIILCNFNVIFIRYFSLFELKNKLKLYTFQGALLTAYFLHCRRLLNNWDYDYNVKFNLVFGVGALTLWVLHSRDTNAAYKQNIHVYNNSMQLLPFETRILSKLEFVSMFTTHFSNSKLIPILPILLNVVLMFGMLLELLDFVPIGLMIDAHSLWHLVTIFPPLIWYDWNLWDMELLKLRNELNKFN